MMEYLGVFVAFLNGFFTPAHASYAYFKRWPSNKYVRGVFVYEGIRWLDLAQHLSMAIWFRHVFSQQNYRYVSLTDGRIEGYAWMLYFFWFVWHFKKMFPRCYFIRWWHWVNWVEAASLLLASVLLLSYCFADTSNPEVNKLLVALAAGIWCYVVLRYLDYIW